MRIAIILFLTLFRLQAFAQADNSKPFVLGVIEEIQSKELLEKSILNIFLPW